MEFIKHPSIPAYFLSNQQTVADSMATGSQTLRHENRTPFSKTHQSNTHLISTIQSIVGSTPSLKYILWFSSPFLGCACCWLLEYIWYHGQFDEGIKYIAFLHFMNQNILHFSFCCCCFWYVLYWCNRPRIGKLYKHENPTHQVKKWSQKHENAPPHWVMLGQQEDHSTVPGIGCCTTKSHRHQLC